MDNSQIAFGCVVLIAVSIGLIILMLSSMDDPTKCTECDPLPLWISTNSSIVEINQSEKKAYILVSTTSRAIFFDFHFEQKEIYWVEEEEQEEEEVGQWSTRIYKNGLRDINMTGEDVGLQGDRKPRLVVEMGRCGGLALDWLHSHMYWIHRDAGLLVQATLEGGHRRVIYDGGNNDIVTIVVDPVRRHLFWTESLRTKNLSLHSPVDIRASNLKGENVHTIVPSIEAGWARNIGLDVTEGKLYYIERSTVMAICDYDGRNKVVVRGGLPRPPAFTVSHKQLFWTTSEGEVSTILKNGAGEYTFPVQLPLCRRCSHVEKESMFGPKTYLRVLDGRMQPIPDTNHHSYKDCLFNTSRSSGVCPCPFGYKTSNRTQTCTEEGYFLASFGDEIQAISMKGKTLPLLYKVHKELRSLDYHYTRGFLFWHDANESKIFRSPVLNPSLRLTVALMVKGSSGLAVDWTYDHLYWTNKNQDGGSVEICKLDGSVRMTIVPRDKSNNLVSIAVYPAEGTMFISNWTDGSVEIFGMDGTPLQRLANRLQKPRSLTLDLHGNEKQIYWVESTTRYKGQQSTTIIKACYLENRQECREVYRSSPAFQPSSLTVLANNIFWLDGPNINYIGISQKSRLRKIHLGKKHKINKEMSHSLKMFHSRIQVRTSNNCVFTSCRGLCVPIPRDLGQTNVRCIQRKSKYKPQRQGYASIGL